MSVRRVFVRYTFPAQRYICLVTQIKIQRSIALKHVRVYTLDMNLNKQESPGDTMWVLTCHVY